MRVFILITGLLACFSGLADTCETNRIKYYSNVLDQFADEAPAVSVAWFDSEKVCAFHRGVHGSENTTAIDDNSIYQIASLSKIFTGSIAAAIVEDGLLDPERSVGDILRLGNPELEQISFLDVVHHHAGLPRDSTAIVRQDGDPLLDPLTRGKLIGELKKINLSNSHGYEYSNLGYAAVALMLEEATGQRYRNLLRERLIEPLSLSRTSIEAPNDVRYLVTPYRKDRKGVPSGYWAAGYLTAASALYSSPLDVAKLGQSLMNCQRTGCRSMNVLFSKMSVKGKRKYGFGINKDFVSFEGQDYPVLYHSGDMDGFAGLLFISERHQEGFILLTSRGGPWKNRLQSKLIKQLLSQTSLPG